MEMKIMTLPKSYETIIGFDENDFLVIEQDCDDGNCVTIWRNKPKEKETRKNNGVQDDDKPDAVMIVDKQRNGEWEWLVVRVLRLAGAYDPAMPVHTVWDLGWNDATAIMGWKRGKQAATY
jgi:hypothetical protein